MHFILSNMTLSVVIGLAIYWSIGIVIATILLRFEYFRKNWLKDEMDVAMAINLWIGLIGVVVGFVLYWIVKVLAKIPYFLNGIK